MLYKRKGSPYWQIDIKRVGFPRIRESSGTADRKEAQAIESAMLARLHDDKMRAKQGKPARRTFDDALLRWLKDEGAVLRDKTISSKARLVLPYLKGVNMEEVPNAAAVMRQAFIKEGLKQATINRRLALVRRILNCAYDWGWLSEKAGQRIKLLAENNERHVYLTRAQVDALVKEAREAGPAILQLGHTGLRLGELFSLTSDNVIDGMIVLRTNTKSGKPRVIPLHPDIAHLPIPVEVTRQQFRDRFEAARVAIGMPHLHAHDLRHTFASWLVQSGAGLTAVRDLLGHAHLGVTSRYTHLQDTHLKAAIKKMGHKNAHTQKRKKSV